MKSIRNFIYNTSDIFVAIIIVAIAVVLIVTRINVIMSYPESDTSAASQAVVNTESADPSGDLNLDPSQEYTSVSIPNGSSTDVVAGLLLKAGLITDTDAFINELRTLGMEGSLQAGVHYIPHGSSTAELINILCGVTTGYSMTEAGSAEANQ